MPQSATSQLPPSLTFSIRAIAGSARPPCATRVADPSGAAVLPTVSGLPGSGCLAVAAATVTATDVKDATNNTAQPGSVDIELTERGAGALDALASSHVGQQLAIVVLGEVAATPTVEAPHYDGKLQVVTPPDITRRLLTALHGHTIPASVPDLEQQRAAAVCDRTHPAATGRALPAVSRATTGGDITSVAKQVLGHGVPPWDGLPADHFVAACSYASYLVPGVPTTVCRDGSTVVLTQPVMYFADEEGHRSDDPVAASTAQRLGNCPS